MLKDCHSNGRTNRWKLTFFLSPLYYAAVFKDNLPPSKSYHVLWNGRLWLLPPLSIVFPALIFAFAMLVNICWWNAIYQALFEGFYMYNSLCDRQTRLLFIFYRWGTITFLFFHPLLLPPPPLFFLSFFFSIDGVTKAKIFHKLPNVTSW